MTDAFTKIVDKLSAYQLFNYFFPGIIFNYGIEQITSFRLAPDDILYRIFVYYLSGMILSRIGSIIIEPVYKKICFVVYARYADFLKASEKDSKIDILLMENNTYRTLISVFFVMLLFYIFDQIEWIRNNYDSVNVVVINLLFLIGLMTLSFRKQTSFIRKRTHYHLGVKDSGKIDELKKEQRKLKIIKLIFN